VEFIFNNVSRNLYLSRGGIHQLQQRQQPLLPIQRWNSSTSATTAATCTYPEVEFNFSNDSSHLNLSRGGIQLQQRQQLLVPIQLWNSTLAASAATCTYREVNSSTSQPFQQHQQLLVPSQRWNSTSATSAATCTYPVVEFNFSNVRSHLYLSRGEIHQLQQR
jgi:hypothetical protein